jgi:hypothetical protein
MEPTPEATAAVKLTRADAVKLVSAEMIEQAAGAVERCEAQVIKARDEFRAFVIESARSVHGLSLTAALKAVGKDQASLHSRCTYRVYEDGTDSGRSAQVIFSDHQKTYEQRMHITVDVQLAPMALALAGKWLANLLNLKAARERDLRVGAMKKEARDMLIKTALDSSDEGAALVAAIKALAKMLREQA